MTKEFKQIFKNY